MKTIEDLKEMKNKTIIPFGNQYDYFFATLENYYISKIDKISCYIEEYRNQQGNICARLRGKVSNKRISIIGNNTDKNHLLRFLPQAKLNQQMMPTIFDRNGIDIVAVRGVVSSEDNEEIIINIDVESGGYVFE